MGVCDDASATFATYAEVVCAALEADGADDSRPADLADLLTALV